MNYGGSGRRIWILCPCPSTHSLTPGFACSFPEQQCWPRVWVRAAQDLSSQGGHVGDGEQAGTGQGATLLDRRLEVAFELQESFTVFQNVYFLRVLKGRTNRHYGGIQGVPWVDFSPKAWVQQFLSALAVIFTYDPFLRNGYDKASQQNVLMV